MAKKKEKTPAEKMQAWTDKDGHSMELLAHLCGTYSHYLRRVIKQGSCGTDMSQRIEQATGIPWTEWHERGGDAD